MSTLKLLSSSIDAPPIVSSLTPLTPYIDAAPPLEPYLWPLLAPLLMCPRWPPLHPRLMTLFPRNWPPCSSTFYDAPFTQNSTPLAYQHHPDDNCQFTCVGKFIFSTSIWEDKFGINGRTNKYLHAILPWLANLTQQQPDGEKGTHTEIGVDHREREGERGSQ